MNGACPAHLDPATFAFYGRALRALNDTGVPYLVGGAYAFERYTGIARHTKDFDIFVRPGDLDAAFAVLGATGCTTEITFPHWLGKARRGEDLLDIIFSSGNGIAAVDALWFEHAVAEKVLDTPVRLCPAEEIIWSKGFIMERERYDGADVAHLIRARADRFDWSRLRRRYGPRWRVLLTHLILYGFIYPAERARVPNEVMEELLERLAQDLKQPPPTDRVCHGTILSRGQYLVDVDVWGYADARIQPLGNMTPEQTAHWTAAIERDG